MERPTKLHKIRNSVRFTRDKRILVRYQSDKSQSPDPIENI